MAKEVSSDEMYGIAKKFNQQMDELPIHTHSAVVELVRVGMQHRNLKMQAEDKAKQEANQERALQNQEQFVALQRAEAERQAAAKLQAAPGITRAAQ